MPVYQPSRIATSNSTGLQPLKQIEIDLGPTPVYDSTILVSDSSVTPSSIVSVQMSGAAPTGKDADEVSMDTYELQATPGNGNFLLYIKGQEGYLHDKFKILYTVG